MSTPPDDDPKYQWVTTREYRRRNNCSRDEMRALLRKGVLEKRVLGPKRQPGIRPAYVQVREVKPK